MSRPARSTRTAGSRPSRTSASCRSPRPDARVNHDRLLRDLYDAFNARDVEAVLAAVTDDVDWPNAWEGGRVHGKDAMRSYWTRQWGEIDPRGEPVETAELGDGRVAGPPPATGPSPRARAHRPRPGGPIHTA